MESHLARLKYGFWFSNISGRFISHFLSRVSIKHPEEIVVGTGHDGGIGTVPAAFELVENAIVFVQRTQLCTQILMNLV